MRLRIFTEPQQGASYATLRRVAKASEDLGFEAFFRSDHYLKMSGGRIELGLGAGWFAAEHAAYGLPFPATRERFDRLEEQLAIITGLWETRAGETFTYAGTYYQVSDSPALPKPVQRPRPPVIVGGHGPRRTPALAARYADEFNIGFSPVDDVAAQFGRVREACTAAGRDPSSLAYTAALTICCAQDDATLARRAEATGRDLAELRANGLAGSPAEITDKIGQFGQAGAQAIYLQVLDLDDLDHLAEIADQVLPQV
jgi:alkanesulfonate monooxygenase